MRKIGIVCAVVALLLVVSVPLSVRTYLSSVRVKSGADAMHAGRYKDAEAQFARGAELSPHDYLPRYYLGRIKFQTGDFQGAAEVSRAALQLNPNYVPTHVVLGGTFLRLGDPVQAREYLNMALKLAPQRAEVLYYMAVCASELAEWEEARDYFEAALQAEWEERAELFSNMGVVYAKLGDMQNAVQRFASALEEKPDDPMINIRAGQFFYSIGKYKKAAASLAKGVGLFEEKKVDPRSSQPMQKAYYVLAKIHLEELGNPYFSSIAVLALSRAVPQEPALSELTDDLSAYLARRGFSHKGDSAALYYVGTAFLLQGRHDRAQESLTMLVESGESDVNLLQLAHHNLALSIFMQGDFERALRVLDRADAVAPGFSRTDELREQILARKEAVSGAS